MRIPLWSLLACSAVVLALGVAACGTTSKSPGSARGSSAASATGSTVLDSDRDNDSPGSKGDTDNDDVLSFGMGADAADRVAIAALIGRYYAAAAAEKGASACAMLYWLAAEAIVEEHDRAQGGRPPLGRTCARIVSKLFKRRHRELVEDVAALEVSEMGVSGNRGLARVRFTATRERLVSVQRERGVWKMDVLLDDGAL